MSMDASSDPDVKQVWAGDEKAAFDEIRDLVKTCSYISLDTDFPGHIHEPPKGSDSSKAPRDQEYRYLKLNVNQMKFIQVGFSLSAGKPTAKSKLHSYTFNLQFDRNVDRNRPDAIEFLEDSGVNFQKHKFQGIRPADFFAELLYAGLLCNKDVQWVTFHGSMDFGYLIKGLNGLPESEGDFHQEVDYYFPKLVDVKCGLPRCWAVLGGVPIAGSKLHGGLNSVAKQLSVPLPSGPYTAGNNAWISLMVYGKLAAQLNKVEGINGRLFPLRRPVMSSKSKSAKQKPRFGVPQSKREAPEMFPRAKLPISKSAGPPPSALPYPVFGLGPSAQTTSFTETAQTSAYEPRPVHHSVPPTEARQGSAYETRPQGHQSVPPTEARQGSAYETRPQGHQSFPPTEARQGSASATRAFPQAAAHIDARQDSAYETRPSQMLPEARPEAGQQHTSLHTDTALCIDAALNDSSVTDTTLNDSSVIDTTLNDSSVINAALNDSSVINAALKNSSATFDMMDYLLSRPMITDHFGMSYLISGEELIPLGKL